MDDWSPLEEGVLLKGNLLITVRGPDGRLRRGQRVVIKGCGFV
jgi:hypothetical protein